MGRKKETYVQWWLWAGALLIFLMVIIGGITRLTDSGLSMSDWNLIMGSIPPLNESEWLAAFEYYKQFPQYQQLNVGMTLSEFKTIFFWEYLHRLLGRLIGIVFFVPFLFFWIRGFFTSKMLRRALLLFGFGALQGAMGWIMVKSGLVDVPYVSHYRLALHLILAFILIGLCTYFAIDLQDTPPRSGGPKVESLSQWAIIFVIVFFVQVIWGALTAGLDAGTIYNTFPDMNGEWLPQSAWSLNPVILNLLENPGTVQWMHRVLGTLLAAVMIGFWLLSRNADISDSLKLKTHILLGTILTQYVLGILTVLTSVSLVAGVVHQAGALLVWIAWIITYHELKQYRILPSTNTKTV